VYLYLVSDAVPIYFSSVTQIHGALPESVSDFATLTERCTEFGNLVLSYHVFAFFCDRHPSQTYTVPQTLEVEYSSFEEYPAKAVVKRHGECRRT
jgi:hypothetical protein